jgi:hypothetical protein
MPCLRGNTVSHLWYRIWSDFWFLYSWIDHKAHTDHEDYIAWSIHEFLPQSRRVLPPPEAGLSALREMNNAG